MTHIRITLVVALLCLTAEAQAAMLRVVRIEDGRTIVVDRNGTATRVRLAGLDIIDESSARILLEWTLTSSWVMLEERPPAEALVWRSPDALFINRELVLRGYARATSTEVAPEQHVIVTYLGTIDPSGRQPVNEQARGSGSGKTARPKAPPSRRGRPRR